MVRKTIMCFSLQFSSVANQCFYFLSSCMPLIGGLFTHEILHALLPVKLLPLSKEVVGNFQREMLPFLLECASEGPAIII